MYYTYITSTNIPIITCERHQAQARQKGWSYLESRWEERWGCYFCHQSEDRPMDSRREYTLVGGVR